MISKWNNAFTNHSYLRIGFVILILLSLVKFNFAQTVFDEEGWELAKEAVLGANVVITQSTKIIDISKSEPEEFKGYVPPGSVVIPGIITS